MTRMAYIFVPGIMSYPGSPNAWTDKAVTWMHTTQVCAAAEKFEYLALPISRRLLAQRRARQLAKLIDRYPADGFTLVLVAHSFGCDIARRALTLANRSANCCHLLAPDIGVKPRQHGLLKHLRDGWIGHLHIRLAGRDRALTSKYLGGAKPETVRRQFCSSVVTIHNQPRYGHSSWWISSNFAATMRLIAGPFGDCQ